VLRWQLYTMFTFQICDRVLNGYRSTHTKRTHGDVQICSACCSTRDCNQGRCDVIRQRKIILCMLYGRKFRKQNSIDNWNWYSIILVLKWKKKKKKSKKNYPVPVQVKYSIENLLKKHKYTRTHKYMTYYFHSLVHALQ